jgi:hypothetical protein
MNKIIIPVVLGGGALAILFFYRKSQAANPTLGIPVPHNVKGAAPRVDNQQQPWYVGAKDWLTHKGQDYVTNPQLARTDAQSVVHSAADVWGVVSGFFNNSGAPNQGTAQNVDATPQIQSSDQSVNSQDMTLPAFNIDQSNVLGAQLTDYGNQTMDVQLMDQEYVGGNIGTIDQSNPDAMGADQSLTA